MDENKNFQERPEENESAGKRFFKTVGIIALALVLAVITVITINLGK